MEVSTPKEMPFCTRYIFSSLSICVASHPLTSHPQVLTTASDLAARNSQPVLAATWARNATALKARFNAAFWVESTGLYKDNLTTTLSPQDANSMAVLYNLTTSLAQSSRVSVGLERNWNDIGPVAPELPDTISPFISGLEVR